MDPRKLYADWLTALANHVMWNSAWPPSAARDSVSAELADICVGAAAPHAAAVPDEVWHAGVGILDLFLRQRRASLAVTAALEARGFDAPRHASFDPLTWHGLVSLDWLARDGMGAGEVRMFSSSGDIVLVRADDVAAARSGRLPVAQRSAAWFAAASEQDFGPAAFWDQVWPKVTGRRKPAPEEFPAPREEEIAAFRTPERWSAAS